MSDTEPARLMRIGGGMSRLTTLLLALWKLARHPRTPRVAKGLAMFLVAYALSPIDLIPDFIPVLGLLDEVILLPIGIALVVKLTPADVWRECLRDAEASAEKLPKLKWGIAIVVGIWLLVLGLLLAWLLPMGFPA